MIRKEVYEDKAFTKHYALPYGREENARLASIYYMLKSAETLCDDIRSLGVEALAEPEWFDNPV